MRVSASDTEPKDAKIIELPRWNADRDERALIPRDELLASQIVVILRNMFRAWRTPRSGGL